MNLLYLLRPKITDEEGINYLATAESELGRVSHIAKQTFGYYREHAAASLASLGEIAEHAIAIYEPRCTAAGITIEKSVSSSRKVVLRRGEMMQVISNLIANAIYAMPDGGTLSISVRDTATPADGVDLERCRQRRWHSAGSPAQSFRCFLHHPGDRRYRNRAIRCEEVRRRSRRPDQHRESHPTRETRNDRPHLSPSPHGLCLRRTRERRVRLQLMA